MTDQLQAARESFSGKAMTETQLHQAHAIAGIIHSEIHRNGSFRDVLTDYSHAFSRNERFDALRGEKIIRDIYTAAYGQSMNRTREGLKATQENLPENARAIAFEHADSVPGLIQSGPTMPFYQALDQMAVRLAGRLEITQSGAKALMDETYKARYQRDLREDGKAAEKAYNKPVRDAEIAARKAEQQPSRSQTQSRT